MQPRFSAESSPNFASVDFIDNMVASQAAVRPNSVALVYAGRSLSYKELNDRAGALAEVLLALGVGPEALVGVCARRSPALVVGALAVWKAAGAYLPLDPLNPTARLATLSEDAQIAVLVTGSDQEHKIRRPGCPVVVLDDYGLIKCAPHHSGFVDAPVGQSKELAYVIYTSGSTGEPNGVEITHKSLLNLVSWHQMAFQLTSADRASQIASVGFDAAVWEIWPYLAVGASVHIPDEQLIHDPESLRNWLISEGITISFVPTAMAELLLSLDWPIQTGLRIMLTGADTLRRNPPEGLPFQLINNYGPTECTVVATSGPVLADNSNRLLPHIGSPIFNTRAYILDEAGQPVAPGTEGELYIGGAGVARGYRNRPQMTAKRFVPDPFVERAGGRLFKTGDVAKWLPDGQIAFVRRMDDQTKVRGFRVEPNEIAAVLNRHPRVLQSLVQARQAASGDRHLVGYVVPTPEGTPTPSELREFLQVSLPDYMVPETFVKLESMPLSVNGKIDRAELPAPSESNTLRDRTFTAPRNELERTLGRILGNLLGTEQVDVEENFFALGGHSLLGAQLIARVRREFGVEMSLRVLF